MKIFILSLLFITYLFGLNSRYDVIEKFYISIEGNKYIQMTSKKEVYDYRLQKIKSFKVKFEFDKQKLNNQTYILNIFQKPYTLKSSTIKVNDHDKFIRIPIDSSTPKTLEFSFEYDKPINPIFRYSVITNFEYNYLLPIEQILYGLSYGIIFCAFFYYLIIFLSIKQRYFLYYSLMQFFVLFSLIGFAYISYKPYPSFLEQQLIDTCETLSFLFTLLFAKDILNIKKISIFSSYLIDLFILFNILDLVYITVFGYSILYEIIPFSLTFLITLLCGIISFKNGNKNVSVYLIGWAMMFCLISLIELDFFPISGIYSIHIVAPIESIIFSFALALTLKRITEDKNEKEKILIHKNRLVALGEMIDNIAHQWRQPLTHLGYINMNLQVACEDKNLDCNYLLEKINESNSQIDFMSNTIDNFRNFYDPNKPKELFNLSSAIEKAIEIMNPTLKNKNININLFINNDTTLKSFENEFSQVILNLITNAKDVFLERKINNPTINITLDKEKNNFIILVEDNAGGIQEENLTKIFDPYFSTKKKSSGIGLYMSKIIIESHFKGIIQVSNIDNGVRFKIII